MEGGYWQYKAMLVPFVYLEPIFILICIYSLKQKFMSDLLHTLENRPSDECHILCLEALRILSREKHRMHQLKEKDGVHLLLKLARLSESAPEVTNQSEFI